MPLVRSKIKTNILTIIFYYASKVRHTFINKNVLSSAYLLQFLKSTVSSYLVLAGNRLFLLDSIILRF